MTYPRISKRAQMIARQERVSDLILTGHSISVIAEMEGLSLATIYKDNKTINGLRIERTVENVDLRKAESRDLKKYLLREYSDQYEKSKAPRKKGTIRRRPGASAEGAGEEETTISTEEREGDVRYLDGMRQVARDLDELDGILKPPTSVTVNNNTLVQISAEQATKIPAVVHLVDRTNAYFVERHPELKAEYLAWMRGETAPDLPALPPAAPN